MDFIIENIYWLVIAAAGIVQWWKSTQEAKEEARRNIPEYDPDELEEFLEEAERAHPRQAVPPPLPQAVPAPPPALKRSASQPPPLEFNPYEGISGELERQAKLAEQVKQLKQAKRQRSRDEAPASASRRKKPVESTGSLRSRLNNRRELKQAFVLKEILEKPIGLR